MLKSFLFAAVAAMFMLPASFAQGAQGVGSNGRNHHHGTNSNRCSTTITTIITIHGNVVREMT